MITGDMDGNASRNGCSDKCSAFDDLQDQLEQRGKEAILDFFCSMSFNYWVLTFGNVQASLAEARIRKWGGETERGDEIEEIKCEEDEDLFRW